MRARSIPVLVLDAEATEYDFNYLIGVTPTGPAREALTEANIHRMKMLDALLKAGELLSGQARPRSTPV